jgi:phospholipid/cholesterol/gamma-HCH transport system substrate-binding protein
VLALAGAAVWLTRSGARAEVRHYTVYFERQSLQGLQVGGGVEMRGIQVGRVQGFAISRDNINRVRVTLRIDAKTPVRDNTVAVVERKILTGLARIALETPGTPGPELTLVQPGEQYPVIAEGHSDLEEITDAMSRLATTGTSALVSVNELLNEQNRKELMATLAGLRSMSGSIGGAAEDLARSGRQLASAAEKVGAAAEKVGAAAEKAGAAAQPAADQASATLRDVSRAVEAFEREFRATAQELRTSAEIVARTAERLDDPRALVFGPNPQQLGPGERLP